MLLGLGGLGMVRALDRVTCSHEGQSFFASSPVLFNCISSSYPSQRQ